jgi:hypothetical protein
MKHCLALICLLFASNLQAEVLKVETIKFLEKKTNIDFGDDLLLPFVSANQSKIAKKINDYLYIDILQTLAPAKASDGIKRQLGNDDYDSMAGVSSMEYKVLLNNGKVFTLQISGEFCGAYCEGNETSYSFDATTGRHIVLQDIFTEAGIETLKTKLYTARVATMKQEIKRLQSQAAKLPTKIKKSADSEESIEDIQESIAMYQSCLSENAESHKDEMKSGDHHELEYFIIDKKGIVFTHSRCSNHASRALDVIDEFHNRYDLQTLKPYLTAYAKNLLLNDHLKISQPTGITGQVFYGSIGQSKITMKIHNPEGFDRMLKAVYFYDKYRQPIDLIGTGNTWTEINSTLKVQPTIDATWHEDTSTGQWHGSGKTLLFKIAP